MKTRTKIELITDTSCCSSEAGKSCCEDSQSCDCELHLYPVDTDAGKARAAELGATRYPAMAINDQLITCEPIVKALAAALKSKECCSCC